MAKIHLSVEADTADELLQALIGITGEAVPCPAAEAPAEEKPKPKRGGRKKAEPKAEDKPAEAPAEEPKPEEPKALTLKQVEEVFMSLANADVEKMMEILEDLGAKDAEGNTKLKSLAEDKYAEAVERANAALEASGSDTIVFK